MRKFLGVLPIVTISLGLLLAESQALGQDEDNGPPNPQDLRSGGSTLPDTTATAPGPTSPTGTNRPPRVGPNTQVNAPQQPAPKGLLGRSETSIAATPDGQNLLVGFNDAQGFCGPPFGAPCTPENPPGLSGFAFSSDGGQTWTDGGAPDPTLFNNVFTRGDPWMDLGGLDGDTFYYANLAVDATSGAALGASVHRGHFNGGFAFEDVHTLNSPNPNDSYDKEAIAVAKDGSGAGYVTLTNFKQLSGCPPASGLGEITVWRTSDGGNTWLGPAVAGPDLSDAGSCGASGKLQQSSVPAIGPNGQLYVAWSEGPTFTSTGATTDAKIVVSASLDGGVTFSSPVTVANINSLRQDPPVGYNRDRFNDHPRIAVDPSKGRVYVVFASALAPVSPGTVAPCPTPISGLCRAQNLTSVQIYISHSDDQGQTWSTPVAVAPAPPATGVKRFWPVVTVEPGGTVDVVYNASQESTTASNPFCTIRVATVRVNGVPTALRRRGTANSLVDTFWAQSLDGGNTFPTLLQVTTATSNWCTAASNVQPNFGDYIGSATGGNHVFPVWADSRNGFPDTFYATLQGAGKSK